MDLEQIMRELTSSSGDVARAIKTSELLPKDNPRLEQGASHVMGYLCVNDARLQVEIGDEALEGLAADSSAPASVTPITFHGRGLWLAGHHRLFIGAVVESPNTIDPSKTYSLDRVQTLWDFGELTKGEQDVQPHFFAVLSGRVMLGLAHADRMGVNSAIGREALALRKTALQGLVRHTEVFPTKVIAEGVSVDLGLETARIRVTATNNGLDVATVNHPKESHILFAPTINVSATDDSLRFFNSLLPYSVQKPVFGGPVEPVELDNMVY